MTTAPSDVKRILGRFYRPVHSDSVERISVHLRTSRTSLRGREKVAAVTDVAAAAGPFTASEAENRMTPQRSNNLELCQR